MTFPEQLKAYRESNGLSQAKLAEFLAVSPRAVWQWEQGQLPHILMQEGALVRLGAERERLNPLYVVHPTKGVSLASDKPATTDDPMFTCAPVDTSKGKRQNAMTNASMTDEEAELLKRLENPQLKKK